MHVNLLFSPFTYKGPGGSMS